MSSFSTFQSLFRGSPTGVKRQMLKLGLRQLFRSAEGDQLRALIADARDVLPANLGIQLDQFIGDLERWANA